jgi:hypothetical protein
LNEFQKMAAKGRPVDEKITPLQNQLFSVREQITEQAGTSQPEAMAMDLIAVIFEFILGDEQIHAGLRAQIGRLQIPFLKAALLEPGVLKQVDHPSRQLLNRIGTVAVGLDPETEVGQSFSTEIKRIVRKILDEFDKDSAIFSTCLDELGKFLEDKLRHADINTERSIDALEEAQKFGALTQGTTNALQEILVPLKVDKRVAEFILDIWASVLVRTVMQDASEQDTSKPIGADLKRYCEALPELVWSAQDKQSQQERNALIQLLPVLVKTLKHGLTTLNLSEADAKKALDQLVAVHTQVLRNNDTNTDKKLPTLDELRTQFSNLKIEEDHSQSKTIAKPQLKVKEIEASLAQKGVTASLDLKPSGAFSSRLDDDLLVQMEIGTRVAFRAGDNFDLGRLIWIGKNRSLFMFKVDRDSSPMVYSPASLCKSMRDGTLCMVESAPTFERAVESLLQGTEAVQQKVATFQ